MTIVCIRMLKPWKLFRETITLFFKDQMKYGVAKGGVS